MTQVRWGLLSTAAIGATVVDVCRGSETVRHVLCEKPFATTGADAERAFAAAEAADRMCVESLMWRHHPQTEYARRLVDDGGIGRLLLVRTALTVDVPEGDIRRTRSLGGGALGDLGCYCVSGTRFGLTHERRDELELVGSEGVLRIPDPWVGVSRHLVLRRHGAERLVAVPGTEGSHLGEDPDAVYRLEFERVSAAIASGTPLPHGRDDTVAQAAVLEALATSARAGRPIEPRRSGVTA